MPNLSRNATYSDAMNVTVRPATATDVGQLVELRIEWAQLDARPKEEEIHAFAVELEAWIDRMGDRLFVTVAETAGSLVGMAWMVTFERVPNFGEPRRVNGDIQSVFVQPHYRKRGVGQQLIENLLQRGEAMGLTRTVVSSNSASLRFYRRLGFAQTTLILERDPRSPGLG